MKSRWLSLVVVGLLATQGFGVPVDLSTNAPPESPIVIAPGSTAGAMLVRAVNEAAADDAADFFAGWQTTLRIIPDAGALGSVVFDSFGLPSPQVFDGRNALGLGFSIGISTSGDTLTANNGISENPFTGGVQIPMDPGSDLLTVDFTASSDASGSFGIYADLSSLALSNWTDSLFGDRVFENTTDASGLARIGNIIVPEPGSLIVCLVGACGLACRRTCRVIR